MLGISTARPSATQLAREQAQPRLLRAPAPWRDQAYAVGVDTRVDTTFHHRTHFFEVTAATVAALHETARRAIEPVAMEAGLAARSIETLARKGRNNR